MILCTFMVPKPQILKIDLKRVNKPTGHQKDSDYLSQSSITQMTQAFQEIANRLVKDHFIPKA